MHKFLAEWLVCPACHLDLGRRTRGVTNAHIGSAEARCSACGETYPIRDGIDGFQVAETRLEWRVVEAG